MTDKANLSKIILKDSILNNKVNFIVTETKKIDNNFKFNEWSKK